MPRAGASRDLFMSDIQSGKPNIFVSYARVDDDPMPGEPEGRVTTLVRVLTNHLGRKLGRADAFDVTFDRKFGAGLMLNEAIRGMVTGSAVLLVMLSPGYVKSEWCAERELKWFLD